MRVAFGCDHAGFALKESVINFLEKKKHQVLDVGCRDFKPRVDYPDYARKVSRLVSSKKAQIGILCCGTGIGMSISANKIRGIRAAVVWNKNSARLAKEHNWANVLCLGGRLLSARQAINALDCFLSAKASHEPHHQSRIKKISSMEKR